MAVLFLAGVTVAYRAEAAGNPLLAGTNQAASALAPGGNMEGKETRFGIANSALFATVTTDASCGAVNAMHDSFTPMGGMVPLVNMMLGEVIFGGVGAGMYGMLIFVVLSVFIAGLMVGRTPEYLGKKIESFDVQMAMLAVLVFPLVILVFTGISAVSPDFGTSSIANPGPHGLSEMLYAYTSGTANNGSAFAGISANTPWYNTTLGIAMLIGRFLIIVPMLALAGKPWPQEARAAVARLVPGHHAAVRDAARRRDRHRRRPDLLPGAQPRPDCRALPDARRHHVLTRGTGSQWPPHRSSVSGTQRWCAAPCSTPSASSILASWCGTRSCSSSRSARP